ncbi:hypothetical protein NBO_14g0010 [Nosema bombycis CQ1]|uniref:Uncharacterized protein n=1 Tax=Nosema bombycis (strain CQ1 / CVCC 102059) TaxID=578461 RepID=R0KX79_NOSB1|nr:hypothetical protein NBO_14g0010 [Nosema bombycis CQ1]|eukprot:EOB14822.1 hypothetical protein NBO_14g0010 [Nosema bombycis CQ1]
MNINSRVYNLTFFRIEKIVIGEGSREEGSTPHFKGVINKFLLVEGSDYKNCRIVNLEGAYLYLKVLDRLERYLRYHNLFGVYLDSPYPYYFNKKEKIELRNVM